MLAQQKALELKQWNIWAKGREQHGFTNVWTTDGRIILKCPNEKINVVFLCYKWACVAYARTYFLSFYFGGIMRHFSLSKNCLSGIAHLINKIIFKKHFIFKKQFFHHFFMIFFKKFVAIILLQIWKSINKFLVSIILILSVKTKRLIQSAILFVIINRSCEKRLKIFKYQKNNIHHNGFVFFQETQSFTQEV